MNIDEHTNAIYNNAVVPNLGEISCKEEIRYRIRTALYDQEKQILEAVNESNCKFKLSFKAKVAYLLYMLFKPEDFMNTMFAVVKEDIIKNIKER